MKNYLFLLITFSILFKGVALTQEIEDNIYLNPNTVTKQNYKAFQNTVFYYPYQKKYLVRTVFPKEADDGKRFRLKQELNDTFYVGYNVIDVVNLFGEVYAYSQHMAQLSYNYKDYYCRVTGCNNLSTKGFYEKNGVKSETKISNKSFLYDLIETDTTYILFNLAYSEFIIYAKEGLVLRRLKIDIQKPFLYNNRERFTIYDDELDELYLVVRTNDDTNFYLVDRENGKAELKITYHGRLKEPFWNINTGVLSYIVDGDLRTLEID